MSGHRSLTARLSAAPASSGLHLGFKIPVAYGVDWHFEAGRRQPLTITEVLPLLYLHGLSSQDFVPALEGFLGTASGLSAAAVTRLPGGADQPRLGRDLPLGHVAVVEGQLAAAQVAALSFRPGAC